MDLKTYLQTMSLQQRKTFAEKVKSSAGHLNNVSYGYRPCSAELAIEIERESGRKVTCEELCPDVDWAFVRSTHKKRQQHVAA